MKPIDQWVSLLKHQAWTTKVFGHLDLDQQQVSKTLRTPRPLMLALRFYLSHFSLSIYWGNY